MINVEAQCATHAVHHYICMRGECTEDLTCCCYGDSRHDMQKNKLPFSSHNMRQFQLPDKPFLIMLFMTQPYRTSHFNILLRHACSIQKGHLSKTGSGCGQEVYEVFFFHLQTLMQVQEIIS